MNDCEPLGNLRECSEKMFRVQCSEFVFGFEHCLNTLREHVFTDQKRGRRLRFRPPFLLMKKCSLGAFRQRSDPSTNSQHRNSNTVLQTPNSVQSQPCFHEPPRTPPIANVSPRMHTSSGSRVLARNDHAVPRLVNICLNLGSMSLRFVCLRNSVPGPQVSLRNYL